jgi:hypothetical protein
MSWLLLLLLGAGRRWAHTELRAGHGAATPARARAPDAVEWLDWVDGHINRLDSVGALPAGPVVDSSRCLGTSAVGLEVLWGVVCGA